MDGKETNTNRSTSDVFNSKDIFDQHSKFGTCIDYVDKISDVLHAPNVSPHELAKIAISSVPTSQPHPRDFLSLAFRTAMLNVLQPALTNGDRKVIFSLALKLVDASICMVSERAVDTFLPPVLLEFLFVFNTQAELSEQIPAIRQRFEAFHAVAHDGKVLFMIKAAMSCINRDKPGSNPRLTGYFRLMLAAALPTWHASGLSRRMQFCDSNAIDYDSIISGQKAHDFDAELYRSFWRAQTVLSNPRLLESPAGWRNLSEAISHVLSAIETLRPETKAADNTNLMSDTTAVQKPNQEYLTIPKYLTSPSILRLQLEDIRVRRQVLTQYAILLHLLDLGVPILQPSKPHQTALPLTKTFNNLLNQGDGSLLKSRVLHALDNDSAKFRRFVTSLLRKERRWVHWKRKLGFNHLSRKGVSASPLFKRRKTKSVIGESEFEWLDYAKGWKERQSAWKLPLQEERLHVIKERGTEAPWSAEIFMMEVREDMRDTDITDDMKRKNDGKYVWRSLRTLFEEEINGAITVSTQGGSGCDLEALISDEVKIENSTV